MKDERKNGVITSDNSTKVASTAFVKSQGYATLANPTFTGTVSVPTPSTSDNSTLCASTAYVKANLANYLPLSGGVMNGHLSHKGEIYLDGSPNYTNNSGHIFAVDNTDWKYVGMYSYGECAGGFEAFAEDSPNNAIGFNCRTRGTNGEFYDLAGRSDGSLLWAGRHIVRSVNGVGAGTDGNVALPLATVATSGNYNDLSNRPSIPATPNAYITSKWSNGANWYRKWSDGWIEQGGEVTTTTSTLTFPINFSQKNYFLSATDTNTSSSTGGINLKYSPTSTSYCTVRMSATNSNANLEWASNWGCTPIRWYACGY